MPINAFDFRCCGDLNSDCCFNFQTWVIIVFIGHLDLQLFVQPYFQFSACSSQPAAFSPCSGSSSAVEAKISSRVRVRTISAIMITSFQSCLPLCIYCYLRFQISFSSINKFFTINRLQSNVRNRMKPLRCNASRYVGASQLEKQLENISEGHVFQAV